MKVEAKSPTTAQPSAPRPSPFAKLLGEARAQLEASKKTTPLAPARPTVTHTGKTEVNKAPVPQRGSPAADPHRVPTLKIVMGELEAKSKPIPTLRYGLADARAQMNGEAKRLTEVRSENVEVTTQKLDQRLIDLICKELTIEFSNEPTSTRVANQDQASRTSHLAPPPSQGQTTVSFRSDSGDVKAAQAVQLIEKIETFVRSQRPALALTLNNSLGARVEIERVGPREVSLKVVGHQGPPRAEDVNRIREEMRARGLRVASLSVA